MRIAGLFLLLGTALAVPHQFANPDGYDNMFLMSMRKSPICWNGINRCDTSRDCAATAYVSAEANGGEACDTCYGVMPGKARSGLCGRSPDKMVYVDESIVPEQLHIAQGVDPSSMTISWITQSPADSTLEYTADLEGESAWTAAAGTSRNYTAYCHGSNTPDYSYRSGFIHHVKIEGLRPNTRYGYRVGSNPQKGGVSTVRKFKTLPAVGDLSEPLSFAVVGDMGQTAFSAETVRHVALDSELQIILHAGDMSYADCDHKRWDTWGQMVDNVASSIPYMVAAGNHEIEMDPVHETTFMAYKNRFAMPEVAPTQDNTTRAMLPQGCGPSDYSGLYDFGNSFYSFEFGGVHAIVLNSYTSATVGSNQYEWLAKDLAKIDRKRTPFVVAMMHGPWYNTNTAHHDENMTLNMKGTMEELFFKYHVNAVFSGHVHAYERSFEVYRNDTYAPGGATTYFVLGDAGNREGHADTYLRQADWSAFRNGDQFGHAKVTVYNSTMAAFEWMRNIDPELVMADRVWLINEDHVWGKKEHRVRA